MVQHIQLWGRTRVQAQPANIFREVTVLAARKTITAAKEAQEKSAGDRVLWSAILFAMGVLTAAFTFIKGESAWSSIHNIILGMFGWTALIVPFVLIYVSVMIAMDKSKQTVQGKVIQCFIIIFLLTALMQVFTGTEELGSNLFEEIVPTLYADGKQLHGGGVFSILLGVPLIALFTKTGAAIIIALLIFVFIMIFSNKTVLDLVKLLKRWLAAVNAARGDYISEIEEQEDFVPPPGAKKAKKEKPASLPAGTPKDVPNGDVPAEVVQEKAKNFNVDIPMPAGKKGKVQKEELPFEPDEPKKELTEEEKFAQTLPQHPVSVPAKASEEAVEKISSASNELDDIIKKAASTKERQPIIAVKSAVNEDTPKKIASVPAKPVQTKQSTLASNKIRTDDELDMPDAPTAADIQHEISEQIAETVTYTVPPIDLLKNVDNSLNSAEAEAEMKNNADTLVDTLKSFGVQTRIVDIHRGPTVTRYELQPSAGVKISKITGLSDDIALNLAAAGVRIEAPSPC